MISFVLFFCFVFVTPEGFATVVANEGLEKARAYLNQVPLGLTSLYPLQRMWCKLQLKTPSEYAYSLFWAELSRLLGDKIPVAIVGLEPGTPGSVVQHALTTWKPSRLENITLIKLSIMLRFYAQMLW